MKIAIVTAHNEAYQPLADITWNQNKLLYAQKWGYATHVLTEFKYPVKFISWERTELIIELLESGDYDWVYACGCDTMVTNFNIRLEDFIDDDSDFVIAVDCYNLNNDSFLAKATPLTINWLKKIVELRLEYEHARWLDQTAMIDTIDMMGERIKIVTQRVLNSYDYDQYPGLVPHIYKQDIMGNSGQWEHGDFLIHWPGVPLDRRLLLAENTLTQVIK